MRKIISLMVIFIMVTGCQSSETVTPSSLPTVQSAEPIARSIEKLTIYKIKAGTPKTDEVVSIFNEKKNGSIVNLENTSTMYTLSESATCKLREILSWTE